MISLARRAIRNAHLCRGQRNESATNSRPFACAAWSQRRYRTRRPRSRTPAARHLGGLARSPPDHMTRPVAPLAACLPDVRTQEFAAEARRQSALVAQAD